MAVLLPVQARSDLEGPASGPSAFFLDQRGNTTPSLHAIIALQPGMDWRLESGFRTLENLVGKSIAWDSVRASALRTAVFGGHQGNVAHQLRVDQAAP